MPDCGGAWPSASERRPVGAHGGARRDGTSSSSDDDTFRLSHLAYMVGLSADCETELSSCEREVPPSAPDRFGRREAFPICACASVLGVCFSSRRLTPRECASRPCFFDRLMRRRLDDQRGHCCGLRGEGLEGAERRAGGEGLSTVRFPQLLVPHPPLVGRGGGPAGEAREAASQSRR